MKPSRKKNNRYSLFRKVEFMRKPNFKKAVKNNKKSGHMFAETFSTKEMNARADLLQLLDYIGFYARIGQSDASILADVHYKARKWASQADVLAALTHYKKLTAHAA